MARCIVILLLVSSAAIFSFQDVGPGAGAAAGAPIFVVAAVDRDDDVCGECPWCQSDADCRHHGSLSPAVLAQGSAAARPAPNGSRKHGRGPILSSLSDSLILSRPPPSPLTPAMDRRKPSTRIE